MNNASTIKKVSGGSSLSTIFVSLSLFFCSLFIYTYNFDHGLYVDELYHLLPAQSILADNPLTVAEGKYIQAELYTRFVASMQILFGESVEVVRTSSDATVIAFVTIAAMVSTPLLRSRAGQHRIIQRYPATEPSSQIRALSRKDSLQPVPLPEPADRRCRSRVYSF